MTHRRLTRSVGVEGRGKRKLLDRLIQADLDKGRGIIVVDPDAPPDDPHQNKGAKEANSGRNQPTHLSATTNRSKP